MKVKQMSAFLAPCAKGGDSKTWDVRIVNPITGHYEDVACIIADDDGKKLEVICQDKPEHSHYKAVCKQSGGLGKVVHEIVGGGLPVPYDFAALAAADSVKALYDSPPAMPSDLPPKRKYVIEVDSEKDGKFSFRGLTAYARQSDAETVAKIMVSSAEGLEMGGGAPLAYRIVELTITERIL